MRRLDTFGPLAKCPSMRRACIKESRIMTEVCQRPILGVHFREIGKS